MKMRQNLYLFKYLLASNVILYMETGAVPAMLVLLTQSFGMTYVEQGVLGGVVYLSLGIGGPVAGYTLRRFHHKYVLLIALYSNLLLTLAWALTPTECAGYSVFLFIALRALMGIFQSVICVYLPLWTNENAPSNKRATYMSYLQASVPVGVMLGYIISTIVLSFSHGNELLWHMLTWRWPFLIQVLLLTPLYVALYFVPHQDLAILFRTIDTEPPSDKMKLKEGYGSLDHAIEIPMKQLEAEIHPPNLKIPANIVDKANIKSESYDDFDADSSDKSKMGNFRRHAISASIFDPLATRNVIKRSSDDLALLDKSDDVFTMLSGFRWSSKKRHRNHQHRRLSQDETIFNTNVIIKDAEELDDETKEFGSRSRARTMSDDFILDSIDYSDSPYESMLTQSGSRRESRTISKGLQDDGATLQYESLRDVRRRSLLEDHVPGFLGSHSVRKQRSYSASSTSNANSPLPDIFQTNPLEQTQVKDNTVVVDLFSARSQDEIDHASNSPVNPFTNDNSNSSSRKELEDELSISSTSSESESSCNFSEQEESLLMGKISRASSKVGDDLESNVSHATIFLPRASMSKKRPKTLYGSISSLLHIGVYRNLVGAMTCLYFTVTGVQYWGIKYLSLVLNTPLPILNSLFILCAATGPTLGICYGGYLIDSYGGYKGNQQRIVALRICLILATIAMICSIPITLLSDVYQVMICLWIVLFCGGGILPACSGILVSIVPRKLRAISSSLSMVIFNLGGYCMSLFASGIIMQILHEQDAYCNGMCAMTWGFRLILSACFLSWIFLTCALLSAQFRLRRKEERESKFLKKRNKVFHSPIILSEQRNRLR